MQRVASGPVDGCPPGARRTAVGYPVLIIDDHELFSTALTMALRSEGFDAVALTVDCVQDYLSREAGPTGLVVLDLDLGQDAQMDSMSTAPI